MSAKTNKEDGDQGDHDDSPEVEGFTPEQVTEFMKKVIRENLNSEDEAYQERVQNFSSLLAIISEWLDTFMIIGYDLNGEEVVISNTRSDKDYNALMTILKKAFVRLVMKGD